VLLPAQNKMTFKVVIGVAQRQWKPATNLCCSWHQDVRRPQIYSAGCL